LSIYNSFGLPETNKPTKLSDLSKHLHKSN